MSNRGFINPIFLIVAAVLVAGGVTAWATGAFESTDASATTTNNPESNAPGTNNVVADPAGSSCPVTGKTGGMMNVVAGESDCSGCPSMNAVVADEASGCSGCPSEAAAAATAIADKAAGCSGCADKSDCSGCEDKSACDGCPEKSDCGGCEDKPEKDCCGTCGGKQ